MVVESEGAVVFNGTNCSFDWDLELCPLLYGVDDLISMVRVGVNNCHRGSIEDVID